MLNSNLLLLTDSYKNSHAPQYPPGTTRVTSYLAPRKGGAHNTIVPVGFQYFIKRYLTTPITMADIDEAESYFQPHMGSFDRAKWEYIVHIHGGKLPVVIYAVPEGEPMYTGRPLMVVENTDPRCFWLTNYLETLLVQAWYPCTVATQSFFMRETLQAALAWSGSPELLPFKLHDFGVRGVSSMETAALGGMAHLVSFQGTDNVPALQLAREYYHEPMAGFSIPASEHSTITSWGREGEVAAYRNMIQQYGDGALYACVSDSYDLMEAVSGKWGGDLKAEVLAAKGTLVVRPDSGDPHEILPEVLERLHECFGAAQNEKGFYVLNSKVRVIQGDHVDVTTIGPFIQTVMDAGYSIDNVAFGSGGGLLQKMNRDTERFAFKAAEVEVNGEVRAVQKDPKTDPTKASIAGRDALFRLSPSLREIYRDGLLEVDDTLADIRARSL